jgi:hypothetical protein
MLTMIMANILQQIFVTINRNSYKINNPSKLFEIP